MQIFFFALKFHQIFLILLQIIAIYGVMVAYKQRCWCISGVWERAALQFEYQQIWSSITGWNGFRPLRRERLANTVASSHCLTVRPIDMKYYIYLCAHTSQISKNVPDTYGPGTHGIIPYLFCQPTTPCHLHHSPHMQPFTQSDHISSARMWKYLLLCPSSCFYETGGACKIYRLALARCRRQIKYDTAGFGESFGNG